MEKSAALKLSADLKALQYNGHFADVIFELEDGISVKAHKALLAARSPFFADMFRKKVSKDDDDGDPKEDGLTHIAITDTPSDVFQNVLLYIYAGELSNWKIEMIGAELLVAAEKVTTFKMFSYTDNVIILMFYFTVQTSRAKESLREDSKEMFAKPVFWFEEGTQ